MARSTALSFDQRRAATSPGLANGETDLLCQPVWKGHVPTFGKFLRHALEKPRK